MQGEGSTHRKSEPCPRAPPPPIPLLVPKVVVHFVRADHNVPEPVLTFMRHLFLEDVEEEDVL